jgi:hypothetical protein
MTGTATKRARGSYKRRDSTAQPKTGKAAPEGLKSPLCGIFKAANLPVPVPEYRFDLNGRRWRFDYAWPDRLVAVEIDGGSWINGRHNRAAGFLADMDKFNAAVRQGWRVLHYTPQTMLQALTDVRGML